LGQQLDRLRLPTENPRMAARKKTAPATMDAPAVLALLKEHSSKKTLDGMARFGIPSDNALGVPMSTMQKLAKGIGKSHTLAAALWKTGCYEARILACLVDEPEEVTSAQMDRWAREFGNWAVCDSACFHLFNRSPLALEKIPQWAASDDEFVKRGAFALLACIPAKDAAAQKALAAMLPLVESAADDDRNFVKKGVSWALRRVGQRSASLHAAALELARRLEASGVKSARWIGKDAIKDLTRPLVLKKLTTAKR